MQRALVLVLVATVLNVFAMANALASAAGQVAPASTILVSLDAHGTPIIEYSVESRAGDLQFVEADERSHKEVRQPFWKSLAACATLSAEGIGLGQARCRPRFELDWDGLPRDRLYPALIRLRNGGVMIFTGYLAATHNGLPLAWQVRASPGTVAAFRGARSNHRLRIDAAALRDDARGWIYIGPDQFAATETASILIDDGVPAVLNQVISEVSSQLIELFASELSTPLLAKPTFYLEWNSREQPGRSLQADVVPGNVIRFGLSGEGWSSAKADDVVRLRAVVAHEIAHFWNNGIYKPLADAAPWLHEGNAELLATAALLRLRLLDTSAAAERLNTAFNSCFVTVGASSWAALDGRDRGQMPYDCGMALQFAISAVVQRKHPAMDTFAVWRTFWQANPEYGDRALVDFLKQQGDDASAERLQRMLHDPATPLRQAVIAMLGDAGIAVEAGAVLPSGQALPLATRLVGALMRQDCAGNTSFFILDEHFLIDDVPACKQLRAGMKLRYVEGVDVLADPQSALASARRACSSGASITLRMHDGASLPLACSREAAVKLPDDYTAVQVPSELVGRVLALSPSPPAQPPAG